MGEIKPWRKGVLLPLPRELSKEGKLPSRFHAAEWRGIGEDRVEKGWTGVYDLT